MNLFLTIYLPLILTAIFILVGYLGKRFLATKDDYDSHFEWVDGNLVEIRTKIGLPLQIRRPSK